MAARSDKEIVHDENPSDPCFVPCSRGERLLNPRSENGYGPLRAHGEMQLLAQVQRAGAFDSQAIGLVGLNVGLAAAAIAVHELIGSFWWLALIGLVVSSLCCFAALRARADQTGLHVGQLVSVAGMMSDDEMNLIIIKAVAEAIESNAAVLQEKSEIFWGAVFSLVMTVLLTSAAVLFA